MASDERDGGANGAAEEEVQYNAQGKKKQKHDKPKPWDHDGIDHWKIVKIAPEDNPSGLLEESSFATLFPQYRGMYETFLCCYNNEARTEEILKILARALQLDQLECIQQHLPGPAAMNFEVDTYESCGATIGIDIRVDTGDTMPVFIFRAALPLTYSFIL
jgi:hypothetical protein